MNARNELGSIIWSTSRGDENSVSATGANIIADAILAAGYQKTRTITTTEEVDALPERAVVMTCFGDGVTIYRENVGIPARHYHFLVEGGTSATVLHEPEAAA